MNKKGKMVDFLMRYNKFKNLVKKSYLYKIVSKFLSIVFSIVLVLLIFVGGFMFFFNMKASSYAKKGIEYTPPFGLYTIISGSMEPKVSVYDVVVVMEKDIDKIRVGDIITFISSWDINYGVTVTHRVIGISKNENGEYILYTKGDNNQSPDGSTVTQSNLIGKVVGRLPGLGRLQFFLATKIGWFLVVFIPALAVIIHDIFKILKLYVLKNQIEKVKPSNEIKVEINNNENNLYTESGVNLDMDEEISLPVIKEELLKNTIELPIIKSPIVTVDDNMETNEKEIIINGTTDIPMVKKHENNEFYEQNRKPIERRRLNSRK